MTFVGPNVRALALTHRLEVPDDEGSFAQCAEELFETLTFEDGVDSESAGALVAAASGYAPGSLCLRGAQSSAAAALTRPSDGRLCTGTSTATTTFGVP